ncbi:MAG TPA: hypothetical protein VGC42_02165 [Kofleriaceae bacterium]
MILLALTGVIFDGCGGSPRPPAGEPMIAKKVSLSWGIAQVAPAPGEPADPMADVFLATTDETGKQISRPLGRYKGACAVIAPAPDMHAVSGVACRTGGTGTELHAVIQGGTDIIVLQLGINAGAKPDPMARVEVARVTVPPGAKIEVAP